MDSAASVVDTDDASPHLDKYDDYSRATIEETQVQNMTRSMLAMATTDRKCRDYNHASSSAVNLQTLRSPGINGECRNICKYASMQVCKYASICKYAGMLVWKYASC